MSMVEGVGATIVVEFGEGVPESAAQGVMVELDETLNLLPDGEVRTQWEPGDEAWFWVHYDPALLRIDQLAATSGEVISQGSVGRERVQEVLFTRVDEPVELSYLPSGSPSMKWYGKKGGGLSRDGRSMKVSSSIPCTADATIPLSARLYRYLPPSLDLAEEEIYRVVIVVYMEAV